MKTNAMHILIIIATLASFLSVSQLAMASDEEEILKVGQTFNEAMNNADLNLMSSLWLQSPKTSIYTPAKDGAWGRSSIVDTKLAHAALSFW